MVTRLMGYRMPYSRFWEIKEFRELVCKTGWVKENGMGWYLLAIPPSSGALMGAIELVRLIINSSTTLDLSSPLAVALGGGDFAIIYFLGLAIAGFSAFAGAVKQFHHSYSLNEHGWTLDAGQAQAQAPLQLASINVSVVDPAMSQQSGSNAEAPVPSQEREMEGPGLPNQSK